MRKCIRPLEEADIPRWLALRADLWPHESSAELDREGRAALVAEPPWSFSSLRRTAGSWGASNSASAPSPMAAEARSCHMWKGGMWRRTGGVGVSVVRCGYGARLGTEAVNRLSRAVHAALGFEEVETLVVFRKQI